jgi:hypothetical protein
VADPRAAMKTAHYQLSSGKVQPSAAPSVSHPDYVAANVPFAPIATLRKSLETTLAGTLKNRGEAHVTTITPDEMRILRRKLAASDIQSIASHAGIQHAVITPRCVGLGESGKDRTFFLVVESRDLLAVRHALADAYVAKGGSQHDFVADSFYPHVTLGFTSRDLFESDGVVKSAASCPNPTGLTVLP